MSSGHFCRLFKKYTFKTPVQYIRGAPFLPPRTLLLESDRKVLDVAFDTALTA